MSKSRVCCVVACNEPRLGWHEPEHPLLAAEGGALFRRRADLLDVVGARAEVGVRAMNRFLRLVFQQLEWLPLRAGPTASESEVRDQNERRHGCGAGPRPG